MTALASVACAPTLVLAQSLPSQLDRDAQRILEQQQQEVRERDEQFRENRDRPPSGEEIKPETHGVPDASGCAAIITVRVAGMTRYRETDFALELTALKGSCTSVTVIDAALRAITNRYIKDGFVTSRALVGPQELKDGVLTIIVLEGRVSSVLGAPGRPAYGQREIAAAFPTGTGDILNLRALEQGVDQLARMSKGDPKLDITPGDQPATSTVLVRRGPLARWIRPAVSFSNDGSVAIGRWQGTASLDIDSVFGLGDVWSLYYQRNAPDDPLRASRAYGGFASFPLGWWTLSLSSGLSDYRSVLTGNAASFISQGRTWNASANAERMIARGPVTKLSATAGLSLIDTRNSIQSIRLRSNSYRIVSARLGLRLQRRVGKGQFSLNAGYDRGLGLLGANTPDTGPGGARGRYRLASLDAAYQMPFAIGPTRLTNSLAARGQWGFDNLFSAQRFSLGGGSTVRGFRDDGISGRSGMLLREQLGFGIADLARKAPLLRSNLSGFLAYDIGVIRPATNEPYERGVLQSASAGFRLQGRHVRGEVTVSVPVSAPVWVRRQPAVLSSTVSLSL